MRRAATPRGAATLAAAGDDNDLGEDRFSLPMYTMDDPLFTLWDGCSGRSRQ
jgi:hypothetical protein